MKKLYTVQYSHSLNQFFLTEKENPLPGNSFDIPIIDCDNNSLITFGSLVIDTDVIQCSKPSQLSFANPFNPIINSTFGFLYNEYAAIDLRNIAASGWHVPTYNDFDTLVSSLGGYTGAAGILKSTSEDAWLPPNSGASNSVGFNAFGSGYREHGVSEDGFIATGELTGFWLCNTPGVSSVSTFQLYNNSARAFIVSVVNSWRAYSIRLVKENTILNHGESGIYIGNDGKKYNTICINGVEWLACNLTETMFRDGSVIPNIENDLDFYHSSVPAYCFYANNPQNV